MLMCLFMAKKTILQGKDNNEHREKKENTLRFDDCPLSARNVTSCHSLDNNN